MKSHNKLKGGKMMPLELRKFSYCIRELHKTPKTGGADKCNKLCKYGCQNPRAPWGNQAVWSILESSFFNLS